MSDNLTVTSKAGGVVSDVSAPPEKRVDDGRDELERLRGIAKERSGKTLDDRTLTAIVERKKAKLAHESQVRESKTEFAKAQGKESVGNKANELETRAAKTTGVQETKSADGLSERDRTAVRSDPKAGPRLPPAEGKPLGPDQAKAIASTLLEWVMVDGKPLDLSAYAGSLKQRSATPNGEQAQGKLPANLKQASGALGNQGSSSTAQGANGARAAQSSDSTPARTPGQTPAQASSTRPATPQQGAGTRPQGAGSATPGNAWVAPQARPGTRQPGVMGTEGSAARLPTTSGAPGAASLSMSMRTGGAGMLAGKTGVSPDGLFNAAGGLLTHSSFDGMNFNWDGFFAMFMIKSQADLHEWRKMLKELRRLEGEANLAGRDAQIALLKMRRSFEKQAAISGFCDEMKRIPRAMKQGEVNAAFNGLDPARSRVLTEEAEAMLESLYPGQHSDPKKRLANKQEPGINAQIPRGTVWLSKSQIAKLSDAAPLGSDNKPLLGKDGKPLPSPRARYMELRGELEKVAGPIPLADMKARSLAAAQTSLARLGSRSDPQAQALKADLRAAEAELAAEVRTARDIVIGQVRGFMADPLQAALVNDRRGTMRGQQEVIEAGKLRPLAATLFTSEEKPNDKLKAALAQRDKDPAQLGDDQRQLLTDLDSYYDWKSQNIAAQQGITVLDRAMALYEGEGTDKPDSQGRSERTVRFEGARDEAVATLVKQRAQTKDAEAQVALDTKIAELSGQFAPFIERDQIALVAEMKDPSTDPGQLSGQLAIGDDLCQARRRLHYDLAWEAVRDKVGEAARNIAVDPNISNAVDGAVEGAIALSRKHRGEVDGLMRETVARGQGMVNQLIQVIGMSRNH